MTLLSLLISPIAALAGVFLAKWLDDRAEVARSRMRQEAELASWLRAQRKVVYVDLVRRSQELRESLVNATTSVELENDDDLAEEYTAFMDSYDLYKTVEFSAEVVASDDVRTAATDFEETIIETIAESWDRYTYDQPRDQWPDAFDASLTRVTRQSSALIIAIRKDLSLGEQAIGF